MRNKQAVISGQEGRWRMVYNSAEEQKKNNGIYMSDAAK